MRQKRSRTLLAACSLCICLAIAACKDGPKVAVCVSDPDSSGFQCYDKRTDQFFFLRYDESEKYVAFSPQDARALIEYCGIKDKPKYEPTEEAEPR